MLTAIEIEHFKSIENLKIDLQNINILVGPNGAGKSNIIDAIRFLKEAVKHDLDRAVSERHGIDSIRQWSPYRPYHVKIKIFFDSRYGNGFYSLVLGSSNHYYYIVREEGEIIVNRRRLMGRKVHSKSVNITRKIKFYRDKNGIIIESGKNKHQIDMDEIDKDDLFINVNYALNIDKYNHFILFGISRTIMDFEAYSIFPNTLRNPQKPSSDRILSSSGENLNSIFKALNKSSRVGSNARNEIIYYMKNIMPNLEQIMIHSIGGLMVPTFRVREKDGKRHDFNVSQISDGTLRVFGILTSLYQPNIPDIVALEEPEQTINPAILALLAEAMLDASERSQILVTTHSPHLVDYFHPDQIFAIEMNNEGITAANGISAAQKKAVKEKLFSLSELISMEGLHGEDV